MPRIELGTALYNKRISLKYNVKSSMLPRLYGNALKI